MQTPEDRLASFVLETELTQIPPEVRQLIHEIVRLVFGTAMAGAGEDGIAELRELVVQQGGRSEARSLVFGDYLPASSAAMLNGTMARALDFCDTHGPGLHLGSAVVISALVAAELRGGCTGSDFLAALAVGFETGAHLNLSEDQYDGFDPTGVAGLLGSTAAAARVLGLDHSQVRNALALSFNRCSGSFQSNADGSLAVRLIQGFTASNAIQSVQLAQVGMTGPQNFITGRFGYPRLFGRTQVTSADLLEGLGTRWDIVNTVFKKFPCCGLNQGPTDSALAAVSEGGFALDTVDRIDVDLRPFVYEMIGHPFVAGDTPRVNAQFSAQYCITNAFVRGSAKLEHFEPQAVRELEGHPFLARVSVHADSGLRGHWESRLVVHGTDGSEWVRHLEVAPGHPDNPLTSDDHAQNLQACLDYAPYPLRAEQIEALIQMTERIEDIDDVRDLVPELVCDSASR